MKEVLIDYFKLEAKETSLKRELLAGATTFITMVYIIFVNPSMMAEAGMDYGASFVGTCLAAAFASLQWVFSLIGQWDLPLVWGSMRFSLTR